MDIESLQTFVTLASLKSFRRTAQELFVVQSTVSHRIRELEQELGIPLIARDSKNVMLTSAGVHFLDYARQIVELSEEAHTHMSMMGRFSRQLRIGCTHGLYDAYIQSMAFNYMSSCPDSALSITIEHSKPLLRFVMEDVIDIAFTREAISNPQYVCRQFCEDDIILVTSPKNNTYPGGITQEEIVNLPLLSSTLENDILSTSRNMGNDVRASIRRCRMQLNYTIGIVPYLCEGFGYAILARCNVQKELNKGLLVEVPVKNVVVHAPMQGFLILKAKKMDDPVIREWFACTNLLIGAADFPQVEFE